MKAWGSLVRGLVVVGALLALPAGANAKTAYSPVPASFGLQFKLLKSRGYSVEVVAAGHRRISVVVAKGLSVATYTVAGRASRNRLDADFGSLGQISMRFRGHAQPEGERLLECKGPKPLRQVGTFNGTLRFPGEDDYLDLSVHHARAETISSHRRSCRAAEEGDGKADRGGERQGGHGPAPRRSERLLTRAPSAVKQHKRKIETYALTVQSQADGRRIHLSVLEARPPRLPMVSVGEDEISGRVRIERIALTKPEHPAFEVSRPGSEPRIAVLRPPRPLRGKGTYTEQPGAQASWTGTLRVPLPGAGMVPLTGPGFEARFCSVSSLFVPRRCDEEEGGEKAPALPRLLYGSGSHSQPFAEARLSWSR